MLSTRVDDTTLKRKPFVFYYSTSVQRASVVKHVVDNPAKSARHMTKSIIIFAKFISGLSTSGSTTEALGTRLFITFVT